MKLSNKKFRKMTPLELQIWRWGFGRGVMAAHCEVGKLLDPKYVYPLEPVDVMVTVPKGKKKR